MYPYPDAPRCCGLGPATAWGLRLRGGNNGHCGARRGDERTGARSVPPWRPAPFRPQSPWFAMRPQSQARRGWPCNRSHRLLCQNTEATQAGVASVPCPGRRDLRSRPTQTPPSGASGSGRTPRCASRARSPRRSGSYSRHPSAPRTCAGCRRQCTQGYARRSARAHRAALDEEAVAASGSTLPFVRSHHTSYEQLCQEEPGAARVGR
jgi:hypothetical protein